RDRGQKRREARSRGFRLEIGDQLSLEIVVELKRKPVRKWLDKEVEGVNDREISEQVNGDGEFGGFFRKDEPRKPIAVGILLPVHEMVGRLDLERVARHPRAAMRRRSQPDDLRRERHRAVIKITRNVMQAG